MLTFYQTIKQCAARALNWLAPNAKKLRKETTIHNMLSISMKSYLDKDEIKGYEQKIAGVTRAAKFAKAGGHIAIALSIQSTLLEIRKACMTGREEACRKAKYVEGAKLVGSVRGSITGGLAGAALGNRVCAAISIASRGTLNIACIAIATGATGYGVSELGEKGMGAVGDLIYEKVYD